MGPIAYLDEAFSGPTGVYVVAAVLVPPERADELRLDLRELFGRRAKRFHWYEETDAVRQRMLEFIADADVTALCVVGCLRDSRAQERARTLGLGRMLWELRTWRVGRLILESRQERNNQRDRRRIIAAQQAAAAPIPLTYDFVRPDAEPLLWMADAIASAILASESRPDRSMIDVIQHTLCRIDL